MYTNLDHIKQTFQDHGISIAKWARQNNYSVSLTYQILNGKKRCLRGQSHDIAVELGLKKGKKSNMKSLEESLKALKINTVNE
ncbi:MAG: DNA-binding protein [Flavobacteriaceae bacterium]|nr:DNA-binding protein [Flavobacteriaceae bacterium]